MRACLYICLLARLLPCMDGCVCGRMRGVVVEDEWQHDILRSREVLNSFEAFRAYLRMASRCLDRLDPHLSCNRGLGDRLVEWEEPLCLEFAASGAGVARP